MSTTLLTTGPRFARSTTCTVLGRILDAHMDRRYISQMTLARDLNVDHAYLSRLRTGTRRLGLDQIPRWSRVLGIPEADLALAAYGINPDEFRQEIAAGERARLIALIDGEAA